MNIIWNQNPFRTEIKLDERDKHMILLAHQNEEYTQLLCSLNLDLNGKYVSTALTDLEEIKRITGKWEDICNLTVDSENIQCHISSLEIEHLGDCTCFPCSCIRCQVEDMLGINTIKGLGKHSARKVMNAFGKDGNATIDEAIACLEKVPSYEKPETWPDAVGYSTHIPRWETEREAAVKWLKNYKIEHGF